MEQISRTVRDRLAAQQTASDHPDADLLTAYAENSLQVRERDTVTAHLARCKACRDLALLAVPELPAVSPEPQVVAAEPRRRWFALPVVGWVAAAAAIAVVGATITLNHSHHAADQTAAKADTSATATGPAVTPEATALAPQTNNAEVATARTPQPAKQQQPTLQARARKPASGSGALARDQVAQFDKNLSPPAVFAFGEPTRTDAIGQMHGRVMTQNAVTIASPASTKSDVAASLHPPAPPPLHDAPIKAAQSNSVVLSQSPASSSGLINHTDTAAPASQPPVGEMAASAAPSQANAPAATPNASAANSAMPAEQAEVVAGKPSRASAKRPAIDQRAALSTMKTGAVGGPAGFDATSSIACSLIADGVRCMQGAHSNELHQAGAKLATVVAQGNTVWAGGQALLRSADAGATWADVKKPTDEAIAQIVLMTDAVYVRTAGGTMWKTADNGASWVQTSATK